MGKSKKYGMHTRAIHTEKRVELPTGDVMPQQHLKALNRENMNIFMVEVETQLENTLREQWHL